MRWLFLTDDHPPMIGGIATFVTNVATALVARGDDVTVVARGSRQPVAVPGTRLVRAFGPSFGRYAGRWLAIAGARSLWQADRIVATTWVAGTAASRLGRDLTVIAHGSDITRPPVRGPATFRRVWRGASQRLAVSDYLTDQLARQGVQATRVPMPVSVSTTSPPPRKAQRRWGYVGRITAQKGVDRFVRWVAAANVEGVVVGEGPALPVVRALAAHLGAAVRFVGPLTRDRLADLFEDLDLVVLAPRTQSDGSGAEGLGLALVEAAAQGVPSVGTAVGGVPEVAGLVVDHPDEPFKAARAIRKWWTPDRGAEAWAACRDQHGIDRTLAVLDRLA